MTTSRVRVMRHQDGRVRIKFAFDREFLDELEILHRVESGEEVQVYLYFEVEDGNAGTWCVADADTLGYSAPVRQLVDGDFQVVFLVPWADFLRIVGDYGIPSADSSAPEPYQE